MLRNICLFAVALVLYCSRPVSAAFVQGDEDQAVADTIDLVMSVVPDYGAGQLNVQMDLYVFNDGNTLIGASAAFGWDNPNLELDSAQFSPFADSIYDLMSFVYRGNARDTSNLYNGFTFTGLTMTPPGYPPSSQRVLWASYFFTLSDWNAGDSIVIDTVAWTEAHRLEFCGLTSYMPHWTGPKVVYDAPSGCCDQRVGDANGIGGDEPTIGDMSVIIDALFITGYCDGIIACLGEADLNLSGGADPACGDITIGDMSILQDYLFITGQSLGLNDCY